MINWIKNIVGYFIKTYQGETMLKKETSATVNFFPFDHEGKAMISVYKTPEDIPVQIAVHASDALLPQDAIKVALCILQATEFAIKLQKERDNGKQSGSEISDNKV